MHDTTTNAEHAAASRRLLHAHKAYNAARAQLALQQAVTARAQADECDASAALEAATGNHAFAHTLRAYAQGCRQRANEWDRQARTIAAANATSSAPTHEVPA